MSPADSAVGTRRELTVRSHSPLAARMVTALLTSASPHPQREIAIVVDPELQPPGVRIEMEGVPGWLFLCLDSDLDSVVAALSAGASGILTMASSPEDVDHALESMEQQGVGYLPVELLRQLARTDGQDATTRTSQAASDFVALTDREVEVLERLARGETNNAIAEGLGISYHTVRSHMRSLAMKLGTQSRAAMQAKARSVVSHTGRGPGNKT